MHKSELLFGVDRFETISEFEKRVSDYPKERISMLNYFKSLGYNFKNEKELVSFVKFISTLNNNWGMSVASLSEYTGSFLFDY